MGILEKLCLYSLSLRYRSAYQCFKFVQAYYAEVRTVEPPNFYQYCDNLKAKGLIYEVDRNYRGTPIYGCTEVGRLVSGRLLHLDKRIVAIMQGEISLDNLA